MRSSTMVAVVAALGMLSACGADNRPTDDRGHDAASAVSVAASADWRQMKSSLRPLSGGASSKVELVEEVLERFAERDTAGLFELLIDHEEFRDIIYPELGTHYAAARDTREETKAFLWEHQHLNARKGLFKALREVGGLELSLVDLRFADGQKQFPSYRLHEGTEVDVRTKGGEVATLLALGTIVERDGVYKLLSYRDID